MRFQEAFKKMVKEGERITNNDWDDSNYIQIIREQIVDEDGDNYIPEIDVIDSDWKIFIPTSEIEITVKVNGKPTSLKNISEETLLEIRNSCN